MPLPITACGTWGLTAVQRASTPSHPHPASHIKTALPPQFPIHARLPRPPDTAALHPCSSPSRRTRTTLWVAAMSCCFKQVLGGRRCRGRPHTDVEWTGRWEPDVMHKSGQKQRLNEVVWWPKSRHRTGRAVPGPWKPGRGPRGTQDTESGGNVVVVAKFCTANKCQLALQLACQRMARTSSTAVPRKRIRFWEMVGL